MTNEIITTLHPDQDPDTNLYPNVKKENIPNGSIDMNKISNDVKNLLNSINELKPSGVDTSTNILAFTTNKGIYVGTDTGHWYYWDGTQYVDGGVYQATENKNIIDDEILSLKLKNKELENSVFIDMPRKNLYNTNYSRRKLSVYDSGSYHLNDSYEGVVIPIDGSLGLITVKRTNISTPFRVATSVDYPDNGVKVSSYQGYDAGTLLTITPNVNDRYLYIAYYNSSVTQITKEQALDGLEVFYGKSIKDGISIKDVAPICNEISFNLNGVDHLTVEKMMNIVKGNKYVIYGNSYSGSLMDYIDVYIRNGNSNVGGIQIRITDFQKAYSFYASGSGDRFAIYFHCSNIETSKASLLVTEVIDKEKINFGNILFIGDSYTADSYVGNPDGWINKLNELCDFNRKKIGVGSATIKDKYNDRVLYPYTDRPIQTSSSGNLNTFACQIEKLKRLIAGVDLDSGESKYTDIPDIIFIQGGTNDGVDSAEKENTYESQFYYSQNAYYVMNNGEQPNYGSVYVKPDIENVDRTCYAGALRYLYEQLHSLYPNAKIYVISPSLLSYGTGNNIQALKKTEQIKKACDYLSLPLIEWSKGSGINYIDDYMSGDGTELNPFVIKGQKEFSKDTLHPNELGASILAKIVYNRLKNDF